MLLSVVLSLLLGVVPKVSCDFNPEVICSLVVDGTKMNDPRACNAWIECIDGKPIGGKCDSGFTYDRESKDCLPTDDTTCLSTDPCAEIETGFAADPYSCNGYYYCKEYKGTRGECNAGFNYNTGTSSCLRDFPCKLPMDPQSICNILPDGVFIKDQSNCNGWQMCWKGTVITDICPGTFYFDPVQGQCDYPQNVECIHTEAPPLKDDDETCPQSEIFVSDKKSCHGYYFCRLNSLGDMEMVPGSCHEGYFFTAAAGGSCTPQEKLQCSFDRCVHLGYEHIELTSLSNDGCRGYAICQDGKTIETSTCPEGEYFDERRQRCTSEVVSYVACAKS